MPGTRESEAFPGGAGFTAMPGGAPANVAACAARLGAPTAFVGAVGEDLFGHLIADELHAAGVDTSGIVKRPHPAQTSIAFVELAEGGERSFTFYRSSPAADELLSARDLRPDMFSEAAFVGFGSIPLISETSRSAVLEAVRLATESGARAVFDVNLRPDLWESLDAAREEIMPLIGASDVVKMSEEELEPLLGTDDPEAGAEGILREGASLALVSLGARGAFFATRENAGYVSAPEVSVVDATGAGDAFLAATLDSLRHYRTEDLDESKLPEAVGRGTVAGALTCTAVGAMSAAPTSVELEAHRGSGFSSPVARESESPYDTSNANVCNKKSEAKGTS